MALNLKRIRRVRDVIAALPAKRFDMRALLIYGDELGDDWASRPATALKDCGTAACIAGWTNAVARARKGADADDARDYLGLEADDAEELFTPPGFEHRGRYTHAMAVKVLDHLIETGVVDWSVAQPVEA